MKHRLYTALLAIVAAMFASVSMTVPASAAESVGVTAAATPDCSVAVGVPYPTTSGVLETMRVRSTIHCNGAQNVRQRTAIYYWDGVLQTWLTRGCCNNDRTVNWGYVTAAPGEGNGTRLLDAWMARFSCKYRALSWVTFRQANGQDFTKLAQSFKTICS
jgi:hypothetical protein